MAINFRIGDQKDISRVFDLLQRVFRPTYGHILSEDQMTWMLQHIFSQESLLAQQQQENIRFILLFNENEFVGFATLEKDFEGEVGCTKLHKLYLETGFQGKGMGKALIARVKMEAENAGQKSLILNVNRQNNAVSFYEKSGFSILYQTDIPIGPGYFMNDYVMGTDL